MDREHAFSGIAQYAQGNPETWTAAEQSRMAAAEDIVNALESGDHKQMVDAVAHLLLAIDHRIETKIRTMQQKLTPVMPGENDEK